MGAADIPPQDVWMVGPPSSWSRDLEDARWQVPFAARSHVESL